MNPIADKLTSFIVMDVLERAQEMQAAGIDVIHLEVGEPDFDVPECVSRAVSESLQRRETHYTHSLGLLELRQEIAKLHKREYGVDVDPDCVVVTTGSSPAILFIMLILCHEGAEVILSDPGYACYKNFVLAAHGTPVYVPLSASNGFQYDEKEIRKKITDKTVGIFINSPMNPTGTILQPDFYRELAKTGITIISDEIYHGLSYGPERLHSILEYTDNAFVLNGFSKRFAMTGLRVGYAIVPRKHMATMQKMQQNFLICASNPAQHGAIAALRDQSDYEQKMRRAYDERRRYMLSRLRQMGFDIPRDPEGAFYIFADARRFSTNSLEFAFEVLEKAHVGITPGIDFGPGGEGFVRFSYANSIENIKKALDRIENYLAQR